MITVCGFGATVEELHKITPVTPPNAGRRWKPIQHGLLIDTIHNEISSRGWRVMDRRFATARDGADMAGALLVEGVPDIILPGMRLAFGFINSNARRKALHITVGAEIMCCTNGLCTGNILLNRVHDFTVNLEQEIKVAVDRYMVAARMIPEVVRSLRECPLPQAQASEILMAAGRRNLVGWAAVGRVDREYRNPTFKEHGHDTSWALLNAFTYAARRNIAATRQMDVYNTFRAMLPTATFYT